MNDDLHLIQSKVDQDAWNIMLFLLDNASVHLRKLIEQLDADGEIDETDMNIQLGLIFGHLNRTWNGRHLVGNCIEDWYAEENCAFPKDIMIT